MTASLPAAVLWDMDGTLVDTEPYWYDCQVELVESFGGTWTREDGDAMIGTGLWHSARVIQGHGVDLGEDEIIDRLTTAVLARVADDVPWRPGARELLAELKREGVPTALVTMSIRRMADFMIAAIDFPAFDAVVAGDEVAHSKPHPEAYLRGAELLGVDVADCVAIEDSPPGLASAVAAGAVALGVEHAAPLVDDGGYTRATTLVGTTLDDLRRLHSAGAAARAQRSTDS
ncbi:HAD family hydrolase [Frigoribacterium faeni]|uniref:HAD superfamily hydrolase (TIGR01509 family) n=1 Tax=Frigoribacterium faeni TaxID=145483 RepID=A0A7W3PII9_9MICO|nr:HAD family phosphatase [Frigoribacterium faeni]MBA8812951.1 HAD superfamily hydrolase (TIGR01509 family) [Frigoribacterium faeni]